MSLPKVVLFGNVVADAELRFSTAGKPWTSFRIASTDRFKNEAGTWVDGETTFIDVTTWRSAEAVSNTLKKGTRVLIFGTLKQTEFETKSGEKRTGYKIAAEEVATVITDQRGHISSTQSVSRPNADPWTAPTASSSLEDEAPF